MRPYERSHPWLTFCADLRHAPPRFWMLLGEAQSKCEHLAGVPLRPETAKRLHRLYLAKGVLATTAIEGNTLSEEQVLQHLSGQLDLPLSKQYLQREIDNVVGVCNAIGDRLLSGTDGVITPEDLARWNALVLADLPLPQEIFPGRFRQHPVSVGGYRAVPWQDCPYLVSRLCEWMNAFVRDLFPGAESESRIAAALVQAVAAHLYLAWIHPFGDGNGRTARLLEFHLLVAAGLPTPAAHLLSNHYNETRAEYYRQLDRVGRADGEILLFLEYALQGLVAGLQQQIEHVRVQQWEDAWTNHVHDVFATRKSPAELRQRDLVLDLGSRGAPVPVGEVSMLSPRLAKAYARKTRKTLTRDVNALEESGLVERTPAGLRARREIVLAFLPRRPQDAAAPSAGKG